MGLRCWAGVDSRRIRASFSRHNVTCAGSYCAGRMSSVLVRMWLFKYLCIRKSHPSTMMESVEFRNAMHKTSVELSIHLRLIVLQVSSSLAKILRLYPPSAQQIDRHRHPASRSFELLNTPPQAFQFPNP